MTSLREGLAATRIADFLNEQLRMLGQVNKPAGAVIALDTGEECTIAGVGPMFDEFLRIGKLINYSGYGGEATTFYDHNFEQAPFRLMKYDETFYKMPYDVRKSEFSHYHVKNKYVFALRTSTSLSES